MKIDGEHHFKFYTIISQNKLMIEPNVGALRSVGNRITDVRKPTKAE